MIHLYIWFRPPAGTPVLAGEIVVADPDTAHGGGLRGEFRYVPEWLARDDAFPLDPLRLPLGSAPMAADNPRTGIHGVFEDALPDTWGQAMLCREHNLPRHEQRAPQMLLALGTRAMGALAFTDKPRWPGEEPEAALYELVDLARAARRFEEDPDAPVDELMRLFRAGSSPGGARPKVLLKETSPEGETHCIAKLASTRDRVDMVRLEAASLACAEQAGIVVPRFHIEALDDQGKHAALLVRRFDITDAGGRNHVLSMKTLLRAGDYYQLGYADMADVVQQVSDFPVHDLPMLYRLAVFNAMLGNTDDHLKNFSMMRTAEGWRLTPAYDLLPDVGHNREHVLHFGYAGHIPSEDALVDLGKVYGLSSKKRDKILSEVRDAVRMFPEFCGRYRVPGRDLEWLPRRKL